MGSVSSTTITPSGTQAIGGFVKTTGSVLQQHMRTVPIETTQDTQWTVSATANQLITAAADRCRLMFSNMATGRVYFRFDTTAVTVTNFHWYLESGERWMVPEDMCPLPFYVVCPSGTGALNVFAGLNG